MQCAQSGDYNNKGRLVDSVMLKQGASSLDHVYGCMQFTVTDVPASITVNVPVVVPTVFVTKQVYVPKSAVATLSTVSCEALLPIDITRLESTCWPLSLQIKVNSSCMQSLAKHFNVSGLPTVAAGVGGSLVTRGGAAI